MIDEVLKIEYSDYFKSIVEINNNIPYFKILIGGKWVMGESYLDVNSPINGQVIAKISKMDVSLADESLERAVKAKK